MADVKGKKKWSVEQRLEFIDFRLFWEGTLRRADIVERFEVSVPQASLDIGKYRESAPENIDYDASQKCYVSGRKFKARFFAPNPARYLAQLNAIQNGVISVDDTLMSSATPSASLPLPSRAVAPDKLRCLVQAIRNHRSISIEYFSMNKDRSGAMWREITPHALGFDGMRWHVRAFCHIGEKFKDFIISRCLSIGDYGVPMSSGDNDSQWNSFFEVVLVPNPRLSEAQRAVIKLDYGMDDGVCRVRVRHALLYYFDKRMRLDVKENPDAPQGTPLIVQNREEYDELLARLAF